jgi:restriction endonuclease Mrr
MLQVCSLHEILICVSKALSRSGFGDVQILDRRSSKQKSRFGGHELMCETTLGLYPVKIVVKVILDDVRTRMVDEMAGTVLRTKADLGLLITPFNVSEKVRAAQDAYRPLHLEFIDGKRLAELMRCSGVGVRSKGSVDYAFFSELEEVSERLLAFLRREGI